jgi:hypothetical protein
MKTQLSKPARSKARYTDQYKQEALELWRAREREKGSEPSIETNYDAGCILWPNRQTVAHRAVRNSDPWKT